VLTKPERHKKESIWTKMEKGQRDLTNLLNQLLYENDAYLVTNLINQFFSV
jgi:hypothetical protein